MANFIQRILSSNRNPPKPNLPKTEEGKLELPKKLPPKRKPGENNGGGCIPSGTMVQTPNGLCPIQDLRAGDEICSVDTTDGARGITARILRMHSLRETTMVEINERYWMTPSHPLYTGQGTWTRAGDIQPGMTLMGSDLKMLTVDRVNRTDGYFEVYTLTTNHPSHNYLAGGLVCANKI